MIRVKTSNGTLEVASQRVPSTGYFDVYRRVYRSTPNPIANTTLWIVNFRNSSLIHNYNTSNLYNKYLSHGCDHSLWKNACREERAGYGLFEQIAWTTFFDDTRAWLASQTAQPQPGAWEEREYVLDTTSPFQVQPGNSPLSIYQLGEMVKVIMGPFAGVTGPIAEFLPDKRTLKVLLTVFDKQIPVKLKYWQVEKIVD